MVPKILAPPFHGTVALTFFHDAGATGGAGGPPPQPPLHCRRGRGPVSAISSVSIKLFRLIRLMTNVFFFFFPLVGTVRQRDEVAGEVPVAFVVASKDSDLTEEAVKDFISKQVHACCWYNIFIQIH